MDMNSVMTASAVLGGMGLVFGAGLAFASQKFAVEVDPRAEAILNALPGANCGGCGYPGCGGFANGVVAGEAPINGCPVGGPECAAALADIMGLNAGDSVKQVARVYVVATKQTVLKNLSITAMKIVVQQQCLVAVASLVHLDVWA